MSIENVDRENNWAAQNEMEEKQLYIYSKESLLQLIELLSLKDIEWIVKQLEKYGEQDI